MDLARNLFLGGVLIIKTFNGILDFSQREYAVYKNKGIFNSPKQICLGDKFYLSKNGFKVDNYGYLGDRKDIFVLYDLDQDGWTDAEAHFFLNKEKKEHTARYVFLDTDKDDLADKVFEDTDNNGTLDKEYTFEEWKVKLQTYFV